MNELLTDINDNGTDRKKLIVMIDDSRKAWIC